MNNTSPEARISRREAIVGGGLTGIGLLLGLTSPAQAAISYSSREELPFAVLEKAQFSAIYEPRTLVAKTESQLDEIIRELGRPRTKLINALAEGNYLVLNTLGRQEELAHSIVTERVYLEKIGKNGKVIVEKGEYEPSHDSFRAQSLATPYEWISIPSKGIENAIIEGQKTDIAFNELAIIYQSNADQCMGTDIRTKQKLEEFVQKYLQRPLSVGPRSNIGSLIIDGFDEGNEIILAFGPGRQSSGGIYQKLNRIAKVLGPDGKLKTCEPHVKNLELDSDQTGSLSLTYPLTICKIGMGDLLKDSNINFNYIVD